nr:hypothetical protein [Tanacetum cinerariifolium]
MALPRIFTYYISDMAYWSSLDTVYSCFLRGLLIDDLDAYDSDCDDISLAKAVLMANLLSYNLDVLSKVPQHDSYQNNDMLTQSVQEMQNFEHSLIDYVPDIEITSDSNIISYEQYLQQTQNASFQDEQAFWLPILNPKSEQLDIIQTPIKIEEIVEHARALRPLDSDLDSACKIVQQIQEVLDYVRDTCPSSILPSKKLVAVTLLNKNKKVRLSKLFLWYFDSGCSKHMTRNRSQLINFVHKFLVINDLKKFGYKKDNYELNYKFLNTLQPEWKQYGTLMKQTKNLMDINIDALYNILKQNQGNVNDALGYKKKGVVVTSDPLTLVAEKTKITALLAKAFNRKKYYGKPTHNNLRTSSASFLSNKKPKYVKSVEMKEDKKKRDMSKVKCYNCKKEGHFAKDCKKAKVKDYNYYKTKMLLAKKDSDEQVLLAEDQAWMESSSDSDQEINANKVFMAQIEKVLLDSDKSSSSTEETIAKVANYISESESKYEYETLEYYDNSTNYGLFVNDNDDQDIFHDAIESASENFIENHIDSQKTMISLKLIIMILKKMNI